MIIGFTGTQYGMTEHQRNELKKFLLKLGMGPHEFHHGDCIGADAEAARMVPFQLHAHPSTLGEKRAFTFADVEYPPKPPLERNRDIVNVCEFLIAAPRTAKEQIRSGTWMTIRYARKIGRKYRILLP